MKLRVPYFVWRDGRPRWVPGPALRAKKWKGRDLKGPDGQWLSYGAAINEAIKLNGEVATWRAAGGRPVRPPSPRKVSRSWQQLYEIWVATPEFSRLAASTRTEYKGKARVFLDTRLDDDVALRDTPVAAMGRKALRNLWRSWYTERGHAMANGLIAVVRAMLSEAVNQEWIPANPAFKLKLPVVDARVAFWSPAKVKAFVAVADELGHHTVADAVIIALHSGQRQADVLSMPPRIFETQRIALSQFKTNALVDAPMTKPMRERVAAIRARWKAAGIAQRQTLIVDPTTGERWAQYRFNRAFRAVRAAAAAQHPELCVDERFQPSLAELRFQDLRDTAITRLAEATCTLPEIASISGHSPAHITTVIKHYLALTGPMADGAIAKLTAWLERERIEL